LIGIIEKTADGLLIDAATIKKRNQLKKQINSTTKKHYNLKMFRDFKAVRQMQAGEYPTFQRCYHGKDIANNVDFEDKCNTERELNEISDEESEREPGEISDD
jgi:hypothetical protein